MTEIDPSRGADARWRGALETGDFRGADERWSVETGEAETDPRTRSGRASKRRRLGLGFLPFGEEKCESTGGWGNAFKQTRFRSGRESRVGCGLRALRGLLANTDSNRAWSIIRAVLC
jgi:hypothetical protein